MLDGRSDNAGGGGGYGGGSGGGGYDRGSDSGPAPADPYRWRIASIDETRTTAKSRSRVNHLETETEKGALKSARAFRFDIASHYCAATAAPSVRRFTNSSATLRKATPKDCDATQTWITGRVFARSGSIFIAQCIKATCTFGEPRS